MRRPRLTASTDAARRWVRLVARSRWRRMGEVNARKAMPVARLERKLSTRVSRDTLPDVSTPKCTEGTFPGVLESRPWGDSSTYVRLHGHQSPQRQRLPS